MRGTRLRVLVLGTTMLGAVACGESSPTEPLEQTVSASSPAGAVPGSAQINQDIANAAAAAIAGNMATLSANELVLGASGMSGALTPWGTLTSEGTNSGSGGSGGSGGKSSSDSGKTASDTGKKHEQKKDEPAKGPDVVPDGCQRDAGSNDYKCPGNITESVSTSRSFVFYDSAGRTMPAHVRGVTAAVRFVVQIDRVVTRDSVYRSARHSQSDQLLSGLLTQRRIWDGAAVSADTNVHRDGPITRNYTGVSYDTLRAVTYEAERSRNKYPLSGTAIHVVSYTQTSDGRETVRTTVSKRVVVTFNGTSRVPMQIGSASCTLDLDTRKVEGCR